MKHILTTLLLSTVSSAAFAAEKPNIVFIICDDLGYGDVHCLAPETSKIPTPNADQLAKEGIEAEIVDLRTLRPLDMEPVIASFQKTNRAVVVEEGWRSYGVGSEIVSRIYEEAFDYIDAPIQRVAQKEVPLPYNATLEQAALPQVADVIKAVKEVL